MVLLAGISTIVKEELKPYHQMLKVMLRPILEAVVVHKVKISKGALLGTIAPHLRYLNRPASRIRLFHRRA